MSRDPLDVLLRPHQYRVLPKHKARDREPLKRPTDCHVTIDLPPKTTFNGSDVQRVVNKYLNVADREAVYHVPTICACCTDRNRENVMEQLKRRYADPRDHMEVQGETDDTIATTPTNPRTPPISDHYAGLYRQETRDLRGIPDDRLFVERKNTKHAQSEPTKDERYRRPLPDPRLYVDRRGREYPYPDVTDPEFVKKNVNVMDLSAKYRQSMNRLNHTINDLNY